MLHPSYELRVREHARHRGVQEAIDSTLERLALAALRWIRRLSDLRTRGLFCCKSLQHETHRVFHSRNILFQIAGHLGSLLRTNEVSLLQSSNIPSVARA